MAASSSSQFLLSDKQPRNTDRKMYSIAKLQK